MNARLAWFFGIALAVSGCGASPTGGDDSGDDIGGDADGAPADARSRADAESCEPPDMLIVLDRTMSMHRRPDGSQPTIALRMESKWYIAISALEAITAALDTTIRFGLELFPLDPGGACVTLRQRINGTTATNVQCQTGEVPVHPELRSGAAIADTLDPETTLLCGSTPIGAGLQAAQAELAALRSPDREQFGLLLTDGQDTCTDRIDPVAAAQALARDGVHLYVIGFDGSGAGVDNAQLNNMACAGRTAPGFPTPCVDDGAGNFTAAAPDGPPLYLLAGDAAELQTQLEQVAGDVCCNCIE